MVASKVTFTLVGSITGVSILRQPCRALLGLCALLGLALGPSELP